jgi:trans-aconitate 2-methyltransferase
MPKPRDWDATVYEAISAPMEEMGRDVLSRLELRGDETVLDAGCGTGRVTAALLDRLPEGRVVAVDGSPAMIEKARERLPHDRVEFLVADLAELVLPDPVDHVLSTATFHWVPDHDALFSHLHAVLKPGGRLVAQCGGQGNITETVAALAVVCEQEPFAEFLGGWSGPWNFATPEETEARLSAAGFAEARCWLFEWPVTPEQPADWFATVMLGSHIDHLPAELRDRFVEAVLSHHEPPFTARYVRLNIEARR